jgi:hypothetical protein
MVILRNPFTGHDMVIDPYARASEPKVMTRAQAPEQWGRFGQYHALVPE